MIKKIKSKRSKTRNATHQKRKLQTCRVFEVKIDKSHLNYTTEEQLNRLFLETKWFYNNLLNQEDIFNSDTKVSEVNIKVQKHFESRELIHLTSTMKQSLKDRTKDSIINLSKKKEKGENVGALNFKSFVNSIPLRQYGNTYKILDKNYIKIQGIKQKLKVSGLDQIPKESDIANGILINKNGEYYVKITTYQTKQEFKPKNKSIGIDFGIKNQLTLSTGIKINYQIPLTDRLRKLAQDVSRKKLHSNNWYKALTKLRKEYGKATNIKRDIKNKIVSHLKGNSRRVIFQDESIKAWQRIYGRRILYTSIGGIISDLKTKSHTPIKVDKWYPSTKTCSCCGNIKNKNRLSMRTYKCKKCGYKIHRDLNASINIKNEGLLSVGTERIEFKPVEITSSTLTSLKYLNSIPYVKASLIAEAGSHCF